MKSLIMIVLVLTSLVILSAQNQTPASPSSSEQAGKETEKTPTLITYYKEVFHVAEQLADRLWPAVSIPYQDVPVVAYDLSKKVEYLINYPNTDLENYEPTKYFVNSRQVLKKKDALSFNYPGGLACKMINGLPVVLMGYGEDTPLENIIVTFIHEGFHYYQFSDLYRIGKSDIMDQFRKDFFSITPRTAEYDYDLVMEGKILAELTEKSNGSRESLLKRFVAVNEMRKKKMSKELIRAENYVCLTEGTASFVELKAWEILINEGIKNSTITDGEALSYSHFQGEQIKRTYQGNLQHFGPAMLRNKINLPSTYAGEIIYRYGLALIRVINEFCKGSDWKRGLFPFPGPADSRNEAEELFLAYLDEYNLTKKLSETFSMSDKQIKENYQVALNEYLSSGEMLVINEKIRIEENLYKYPFDDGWTYKIEAGQFLYTYFDWLHGKAFCDKKMRQFVYFNGLFKLETADKSLIIEKISIPVISNMFEGNIRFKDIGADFSQAKIIFSSKANGVYQNLELQIPGLKLFAKKAEVIHDKSRKETVIRLSE